MFCVACQEWQGGVEHLGCPYGSQGSLVWIDLDSHQAGCGKCKMTWPLEVGRQHCGRCGQWQETIYVDAVEVERVDQIIQVNSETGPWYGIIQSGRVVMSRNYPTIGVEN
jgi:hypothetical protein